MPARVAGAISFAIPLITIPEHITISGHTIDDVADRAALIADPTVKLPEALPAIADRVTGIGIPTDHAFRVSHAGPVVAVPEQIAIFCDREHNIARAMHMEQILPAGSNHIA